MLMCVAAFYSRCLGTPSSNSNFNFGLCRPGARQPRNLLRTAEGHIFGHPTRKLQKKFGHPPEREPLVSSRCSAPCKSLAAPRLRGMEYQGNITPE